MSANKTERMQAVILAAGRGLRLRPITDKIPKSLVEANDTPFIINELEALSKHKEIREVIIVVGYKKDLIKEKIGNEYKGVKILYVENDEWDKTNNIYSLWMAGYYINVDFILMEGDIFFEYKLLDLLFENKGKNMVLLSSYKPYMSGTVVEINERDETIKRLIPISGQGENFDYAGKYKTINLYSFTYEFFKTYLKPTLDLYVKTHTKDYWELILGVLVYLNTPNIHPYIVDDNTKWYEIDDENDLDIANYMFADENKKMKILSQSHGGLWRYKILDFCYLTNVYFPTKQFYAELSLELPQLVQNYPSAQHKICKLLSRWYADEGFNWSNLLVGNGASELIRILNRHFIKKITIPIPTFNEYEDIKKEQISYFPLKENENFMLNPDDYIEVVKSSGSNFALIINPNNPTGTLFPKRDIIKIVENLKLLDGIIVDESFINFTGNGKDNSVQSLITEYQNLVIIHSIGKEFGVLGLRLGYMVTSNKKILEKAEKYLPIWNINSVAEKFIALFPKYKKDFEGSIKKIIEEREYLYSELMKIDFLKTFPSHANFFLCKITNGMNSKELCTKLLKCNIYVKDCSNKTSLNDKFVRIAVRTRQDNDALIGALREIKKEVD